VLYKEKGMKRISKRNFFEKKMVQALVLSKFQKSPAILPSSLMPVYLKQQFNKPFFFLFFFAYRLLYSNTFQIPELLHLSKQVKKHGGFVFTITSGSLERACPFLHCEQRSLPEHLMRERIAQPKQISHVSGGFRSNRFVAHVVNHVIVVVWNVMILDRSSNVRGRNRRLGMTFGQTRASRLGKLLHEIACKKSVVNSSNKEESN
jgi:hypothetical protein